ncbi:MAG TPA: aminotransferase class I/II-fold pyridoxal phosphate-dependent enzyme [Vicinamibacteria bacterium]
MASVASVASAAAPEPGAPGSGVVPASTRFDFDTTYDRFGTDCVKFDQQIRIFGKDSVQIGMGVADMDFRAAPVITSALRARLQHENWGYLDEAKSKADMAEAIAAWNKRRYGVDIDPASIELAGGVHPALISALQTFSPRGSRVLLQTPTYDGFYTDLNFTGTRAEESPLRREGNRYSMDFEDFERRIGHDTNTFILCNPQNPTGNCWSAEDLLHIGEICLRRRVLLLADEIHCDYVTRGNRYTPFASLRNREVVDNSITFKAASKSFGLAAHKCGWFYSTNPDLMARVRANHRSDLSTLGLVANRAALTGGEAWLDQAVEYIDGNHDFVQRFLAAEVPAIKASKPEGTYLAWLDVTAVADRIGSKQLALEANRTKAKGAPDVTPERMVERFFVKQARVQLNPGSNYGLGGANHMRMNLATSRRLIEAALTNIAGALKT